MQELFQLEGAGGKLGGGASSDADDTLKAHSTFRGLYVVSEGPIVGPPDTNIEYDVYLNDVPIRDQEGRLNFQGMSWAFNFGSPDQQNIPGFDAAYTPVIVATKVFYGLPLSVTVAGDYDAIAVTIKLPSLYKVGDDGSLGGADLSFAIDVLPNGSSTWGTVYQENFTNEKTTTEYERTYRIDLPPGGSPWQVRLRRITEDSTSVKLSNDLYFQRYDTIIDGKFSYPNISLLGLMLDAKQFGTQIPKVSVKWKGIKVWVPTNYDPIDRTYATSGPGTSGGIWDGTFKLAWTDNPAWIFYDIIINNRYGLGQELNPLNDPANALIDKWNLYTIAQYCDGAVDNGFGGTEPRFTFNAYITTRSDAFTFLQQMASTFRGILYFSSNQIYVSADIPENVDTFFTQADVKDGLFNYVGSPLKTRSSVVVVEWKNPNNQYKTEVEVVEDFDAIRKFGYRQKQIQGMGITSRGAARRLAKWLLLTEKMQTETVTFTGGLKAAQLTPGMIIKVVDSYKSGVRWGGRLLDAQYDGANTIFTLDNPVTLAVEAYTFTYVNADGTLSQGIFSGTVGDTSTITIAGSHPIPDRGTVWMLSSPDLDGALYRVVSITESSPGEYQVIALQHYPEKYALIENGPDFPDPPTSVLNNTQLPAPTNLTVSQWYQPASGSISQPRVTISWTPPSDKRILEFELQVKTNTTPWATVYTGPNVSWDSTALKVDTDTTYQARVRSVSAIGTVSAWTYSSNFSAPGDVTAPDAPTGLSATPNTQGIYISWIVPPMPDFAYVQVWESSTSSFDDGVLLAQVATNHYTRTMSTADVDYSATRYYWVRTVTHSAVNNVSVWTGPVSATTHHVDTGDVVVGAITQVDYFAGANTTVLSGTESGDLEIIGHTTIVDGAPHIIDFAITMTHTGTGNAGIAVHLKRDGSNIGDYPLFIADSFPGTCIVKAIDHPPAGFHTYSFTANTAPGSSGTSTYANSVLIVTELKR